MKGRNFVLLSGAMFAALGIPAHYHFFGKIKYPGSRAHPDSLVSILDRDETIMRLHGPTIPMRAGTIWAPPE
jgi:hypothetical protein